MKLPAVILIFFVLTFDLFAQRPVSSFDSVSMDTIYGRYVVIKPLSGDQILLKYREELNKDMDRHREYLETYYNNILKTIGAIGLLISAVLTFFGFRHAKDIKEKVEQLYEKNTKDILKKFFEDKTAEISSKIALIEKELKYQVEVNLNQEKFIRELDSDIEDNKKLPQNYRIKRSLTCLEYETNDGQSVLYRKEQHIVGTSETDEVRFARETIHLCTGGQVEVIQVNDDATVKNRDNKCEILVKFEPPLKHGVSYDKLIRCRLKNSFTSRSEWWEVVQLYKCDSEILVLKLPIEMNQPKFRVEEKTSDERSEYTPINVNISEYCTQRTVEYRLELPATDTPMRYRVNWEI